MTLLIPVLANGHRRFYGTHFAASKANKGDDGGRGESRLEVVPENRDPVQVPELVMSALLTMETGSF